MKQLFVMPMFTNFWIALLCQAPDPNNPQGHNINESTLDLSLGLAGDGENDLLKDESEKWRSVEQS